MRCGGGGAQGHAQEDGEGVRKEMRALEEKLLAAENQALDLRFEKEQATLKANRLQDRLSLFLDRCVS